MITPGYVHTMARYNAEANRRWYGAAAGLSEAQRLRELERENTKLKELLADQLLKNKALEIALEKNA